MKALLLVPLLLLAGCVSVPPGTPVQTYYVIQQPYVVYEPRVTWGVSIGYSRGYYYPGPWRHHRR